MTNEEYLDKMYFCDDNGNPIKNCKYKLYAGSFFYPYGGHYDFQGNFENIEEAIKFIETKFKDEFDMWAHVVCDDKILLKGKCYYNIYELKDESRWSWKE